MSAIALLVQAAQSAAAAELLANAEDTPNQTVLEDQSHITNIVASPLTASTEEVADEPYYTSGSSSSSVQEGYQNSYPSALNKFPAPETGKPSSAIAEGQRSQDADSGCLPASGYDGCDSRQIELIPSKLLAALPLNLDVSQAAIEAAVALSSVSKSIISAKPGPDTEQDSSHISQAAALQWVNRQTSFHLPLPPQVTIPQAPPSSTGVGKRRGAPLRRGKWTPEEEAYANRLIQEFKAGLLPLADGTTLRTFLSKSLSCDPMRISKKFVGSNCIGKQVFRRRTGDIIQLTPEQIAANQKEISE
jgi:hypothetical protein